MKREFYAQNKELQDVNLNRKIELCEKAEEIKDSTDCCRCSIAVGFYDVQLVSRRV